MNLYWILALIKSPK